MSDFATVARQYLDEKIPGISDNDLKGLLYKLSMALSNTQPMMIEHTFFENVDYCYNSKIDGKTDEEKMEQFVRLYKEAPRPLDPVNFNSDNQIYAYLSDLVEAVRRKQVPPVNVIQILHKGKVFSVISNGRTRAAASKIANTKIPTKLLTFRI
jgi:hypothetical protein